MDRQQKDTQINEIRGLFEKMGSAILVDYKGMTVAEITKLREAFRKVGVDYKVVKNTFVKHAIKDASYKDALAPHLTGMTGVAWSYDDPSAAAKIIKAYKKDAKDTDAEKLKVKAGILDGELLDAKQVEGTLASMPGKDELRAMLLATLQAPSQQFVQQLQAAGQNFVYLLAAKEAEGK